MKQLKPARNMRLQFHLLPIRDWNENFLINPIKAAQLQFHLLPIRDWNFDNWLYATTSPVIAISLTPY